MLMNNIKSVWARTKLLESILNSHVKILYLPQFIEMNNVKK